MNKFSQINVISFAQVQNGEESLTNDTREIGVGEEGDLVDAFGFVVRLRGEVLVDILEVRDSHVFLELLVVQDAVVDVVDFVSGLV